MRKSIKATLFSALVGPGLGQFVLNRVARGLLFFVPAMLALVFILHDLIQRFLAIVDKILNGAVSPDVATITRMVAESESNSPALSIATAILLACWVLSTIDAFWLGNIEDRKSAQKESEK